jgi:hypothetical protein
MTIHGPTAGLQVGLQGSHHCVKTWIENGAAIHVHDLMTTAAVVASTEPSLRIPFQGNYGAVAISQLLWSREQRLNCRRQLPDSLQCFQHQLMFPLLLGHGLQALEGATATVIRKDAGRFSAMLGGFEQAYHFPHSMVFGLMHQTNLDLIPWKGPLHKNHLAFNPAHPQTTAGEVINGEGLKAPVQPLSLWHRSRCFPDPIG